MTLFLNFITAAALLWGGLMAIGILLSLVVESGKELSSSIAGFISSGFLAWAWLIARYCL